MDKTPITTHILDLVRGEPASGVNVHLLEAGKLLANGITNEDGRIEKWDRDFRLVAGKYRLVFDVEPWFAARAERNFYEDVQISFRVDDLKQHYHVPLLLSPFGYSTYRGS